MSTFDGKIFWREDFDGESAEGGIFTRSVDLKKCKQIILKRFTSVEC